MKIRSIPILALGLSISLVSVAGAEDPSASAKDERDASAKAGTEAQATPAVSMQPALYQLPKVGKPRKRVGGGRRSAGVELPQIYALVPAHVGLTVAESPTLFWYLPGSAQGKVRFELTLTDDESFEPLIDVALDQNVEPGLQRIDLSKYGAKLEVGREYEWFVALVPDDSHRSDDVVSSGWIERVPEPAKLAAELTSASAESRPGVYGRYGLWYDVLAASNDLTRENPQEARYRESLAGLLAQVGLPPEAAGTATQ